MSVLVVGLNHHSAPLDLLERVSFDAELRAKALHHAVQLDPVRECVILSTCNRVEIYGLVSGFHAGLASLRGLFGDIHHVSEASFADRTYALYDADAARHLFGVAGGIDSMVLGEPQILAQVREAFRAATDEGAAGPILSALFRHGIKAGRRARAETDIARLGASFATAGAALARREMGTLGGKTVLLLGAGKMTTLSARVMAREGARLLVANRTHAKAEELASRAGGSAVPMRLLVEALAESDLVLASTGSSAPVVTAELVEDAMRDRAGRPLTLLDLALPRDVDPACAGIPGVTVRDLDALRDVLAPTADQLAEVERVREIIAAEVPRFIAWRRSHALAPLIESLLERAEAVRSREIARAGLKLGELSADQRDAVEALTRAIVAKLLHGPLTSVKNAAGTPEAEALARALRDMFGLLGPEA